jgi:hypothetical protein
MAPVNSEPECWNCRHFLRGDKHKSCVRHGVLLPMDLGPHLICTAWELESDATGTVAWWRRRYLTDNDTLYRYVIYSAEAPLPLTPFKKLERAS